MSTASLSVLVAALAVLVGAVFQYLAIRNARRNTVSQLLSVIVESRIAGLRNALADYITLSYPLDLEFRSYKVGQQSELSAEYYERARQEDRLYNLLRLHLDGGNPLHRRLLASLEYLRSYDADEVWIERRDKLVAVAREVFSAETDRALA
jgi:hypothetical protein